MAAVRPRRMLGALPVPAFSLACLYRPGKPNLYHPTLSGRKSSLLGVRSYAYGCLSGSPLAPGSVLPNVRRSRSYPYSERAIRTDVFG